MTKFTKRKKVSELKDGDRVDDVFFVKFKKGIKEYAKGYSFDLTLSDNSNRSIEYKYWGPQNEARVKAIYNSFKADSIVHVQGKVTSYHERLQLSTNEPDIIEPLNEGEYNESDFIKAAKKDIEIMYSELESTIEEIKDPKLKELLTNVFADKDMEMKFKKHPGAIEIHHGWIGGLLQHTLEVIAFCKTACDLHPELNRDLVLTGAMLHDIGKLEEIEVTHRIRGTRKGQLTSHLVLSAVYVSNKCDEVKMDECLKDKLMHIIVSHHGKEEFGAPKPPMFPEAIIVYYADELSAKVTEMIEFIENGRQETEDDFIYYRREGKNIYLR